MSPPVLDDMTYTTSASMPPPAPHAAALHAAALQA
jgi:hypothetical protein